jgi:hypothetical protein
MAYTTTSFLDRYQQLLDLPEGEPTGSACVWTQGSSDPGESPLCDGECQNCCQGLVEVVRQFSERPVHPETRNVEFADTQTLAGRVGR